MHHQCIFTRPKFDHCLPLSVTHQPIKQNLPSQVHEAKPTKPNLPQKPNIWIYQTKPLESYLTNKINQTKPFKRSLPNQTKQTKTINQTYQTKPSQVEFWIVDWVETLTEAQEHNPWVHCAFGSI